MGHSQNQIRPLTKSPARGVRTTWPARNKPQGGELSSRAGSCLIGTCIRENPTASASPAGAVSFGTRGIKVSHYDFKLEVNPSVDRYKREMANLSAAL